jgi:hypothetical protein
MSYQVRHKEMGVYQGECLGLGFWHPMSKMPELGYCEFRTEQDAQQYVDFLCSRECATPEKPADFTIEPFDRRESEGLRQAGLLRFNRSAVVH